MTRWRWFARMAPAVPDVPRLGDLQKRTSATGSARPTSTTVSAPAFGYHSIADALADHGITAGEGRHYLRAMKDTCPDRLVGCSIDSPMMAFLAVTALPYGGPSRLGGRLRGPRGPGVADFEPERSCTNSPTTTLWGRGVCGDDIAMSSTFVLLRRNVPDRQRWSTREELRLAIVTCFRILTSAGPGNAVRATAYRSSLRPSITASRRLKTIQHRVQGKSGQSHCI